MDAEEKSASESTEQNDPRDDALLVPPELLEAVPEDRRDEFSRRFGELFLAVRREEHYAGPLQPAREAERWDALVPGTAARNFDLYEKQQLERMEAQGRILTIAEETARHKMQLESANQRDSVALTKTELNNSAADIRRGQLIGAGAALLLGAGALHAVNLGNDGAAIAVMIGEVALFAGVFLPQWRSRRDQLTSKDSSAGRRSTHADQRKT